MKKLDITLDGELTLDGKIVKAKPIGRPLVVWYPIWQEERKRDAKIKNRISEFVMKTSKNGTPDFYLEGKKMKRDDINYIPIQFYKLEE